MSEEDKCCNVVYGKVINGHVIMDQSWMFDL